MPKDESKTSSKFTLMVRNTSVSRLAQGLRRSLPNFTIQSDVTFSAFQWKKKTSFFVFISCSFGEGTRRCLMSFPKGKKRIHCGRTFVRFFYFIFQLMDKQKASPLQPRTRIGFRRTVRLKRFTNRLSKTFHSHLFDVTST